MAKKEEFRRNKTNWQKLEQHIENKKSQVLVDNELKALRIKENINVWEKSLTKHQNLPYIKALANKLKSKVPTRILLMKKEAYENEKAGYLVAKHLINSGVTPSKIVITTLDECYLSVRGFGEMASTKERIFNSENELIIIEDMREIRNTDVKDNVYSFWQEFFVMCKKNKRLHVILCFDKECNDWYPKVKGDKTLQELGFVSM